MILHLWNTATIIPLIKVNRTGLMSSLFQVKMPIFFMTTN